MKLYIFVFFIGLSIFCFLGTARATTNLLDIPCGNQLNITNEVYLINESFSFAVTCYRVNATNVSVEGNGSTATANPGPATFIVADNQQGFKLNNLTLGGKASLSLINMTTLNLSFVTMSVTSGETISGRDIYLYFFKITNSNTASTALVLNANSTFIKNSSFTGAATPINIQDFSHDHYIYGNTFQGTTNAVGLADYVYNSTFKSNSYSGTNIGACSIGGNGTILIGNTFAFGSGSVVISYEGTSWYNNSLGYSAGCSAFGLTGFQTGGDNIYVEGGFIACNGATNGASVLNIFDKNITFKNLSISASWTTNAGSEDVITIGSNGNRVAKNIFFDNVAVTAGSQEAKAIVFSGANSSYFVDNVVFTGRILSATYNVTSLRAWANNITFLNVTYPVGKTDEIFVDSNVSNFFRSWYYDAYVNSTNATSGNLENVTFTISGTNLTYTYITNSTGRIPRAWIAEYRINNYTKELQNNYTITLSNSLTEQNNTNLTYSRNFTASQLFDFFMLQYVGPTVISSIIPSGGGGSDTSNTGAVPYSAILDPLNPNSPVHDTYVPGESSGSAVNVRDGIRKNVSWIVQTDGGGNVYTMILSSLVPKRAKSLAYTNTGTEVIKIQLGCEGTICPYIKFRETNITLTIGKAKLEVVKFDVDYTKVSLGKYTGNLISMDQYGNVGIISITASKGSAGILVDLFNKLIGIKTFGDIKIPYVAFYAPLFVLVFFIFNLLLSKMPSGAFFAFLIGIASVIALLLII